MKYVIGDRIRIKSLDWYNKYKDEDGFVDCGKYLFYPKMAQYCNKVFTISDVYSDFYLISENEYDWTDEMIEGLVENTKPKFKIGDEIISDALQVKWKVIDVERTGYKLMSVNNSDLICDMDFKNEQYYKLVEEETKPKFKVGDRVTARGMSGIWEVTNVEDNILYTIKRENHTATLTTYGGFLTLYEELTDRAFKDGYEKCKSDIELNGFQLPDGFIFIDENGNVINATKIVLKKKKEYPKTYEECCKVLGCKADHFFTDFSYKGCDIEISDYEDKIDDLLKIFRKLIYCRNAYWKLYGEEIGLGKPWEPSKDEMVHSIYRHSNKIGTEMFLGKSVTFEFPTAEIRDAFKENFDPDIEFCKEFL